MSTTTNFIAAAALGASLIAPAMANDTPQPIAQEFHDQTTLTVEASKLSIPVKDLNGNTTMQIAGSNYTLTFNEGAEQKAKFILSCERNGQNVQQTLKTVDEHGRAGEDVIQTYQDNGISTPSVNDKMHMCETDSVINAKTLVGTVGNFLDLDDSTYNNAKNTVSDVAKDMKEKSIADTTEDKISMQHGFGKVKLGEIEQIRMQALNQENNQRNQPKPK